MKSHLVLGIGTLALAVGVSFLNPHSAFSQTTTLWTTQEDFSGWFPNDGEFTLAPQAAPDTDGSSTNGLGFSADPGGAGTPGSLSVTWQTGTFTFFFSNDLAANTAVRNLLAGGGTIVFDYTQPPPGTGNYFVPGVMFNYDGHFAPFLSGTTVNHNDGTFTASVPFTSADYVDANVANYLQLGIVYNSNYNTMTPFTVDNVRFVAPPAPVAGDYNGNHVVDAADYTIWRDTQGSTTDLRANGDNTGASANVIDNADYLFWKNHFNGSGSGSGGLGTHGVPEPANIVLSALGLVGLIGLGRRRVIR